MPLFSFTKPSLPQNQSYAPEQQGMSLIDPGSALLSQADPYAVAGRQALGNAFQQAGQMGPPAGMPQDADAYLAAQGITPQALAQGLMAQPPSWTTEASYPKPNFGRKGGVWT